MGSLGRRLCACGTVGPIFTKELRVASRRRRHYLMRFGFLALLTLFVVMVYVSSVQEATGAYQLVQMSEAGKHIIVTVMWFSLMAGQLVAVALMSTSISNELYHRTLPVLMTTPVGAARLVVDKLFSGLWQLLLLLAMSFPLLGVVRVFGGVPWRFVIAGTCITLTASLFAGLVAMFYSAIFRRAYVSILLSLATGFVLYGVVPNVLMLVGFLLLGTSHSSLLGHLMMLWPNPPTAMMLLTFDLYQPAFLPVGFAWGWVGHCIVMLILCAVMVGLCTLMVRKVSFRNAFGNAGRRKRRKFKPTSAPAPSAAADAPPAPPAAAMAAAADAPPLPSAATEPPKPSARARKIKERPLRRISGSPLMWHELRQPMIRSLAGRIVLIVVAVVAMLSFYVPMGMSHAFEDAQAHATMAFMYVLVAIVGTSVIAATNITGEKESGTLGILLTTPIGDSQIVTAKAAGVLRRSLPLWIPLFLHTALFGAVGFLHVILLPQLLLLALGTSALLTMSGLLLGCRLRKTMSAVIANMAFAGIIWILLPVLLSFLAHALASDGLRELLDIVVLAVPPLQAWSLTATSGVYDAYPVGSLEPVAEGGAAQGLVIAGVTFAFHALLAGLLWLGAVGSLRRKAA
ncbi:MAG: ABC transporter permease subunit [Phycisphaerae bacterium]